MTAEKRAYAEEILAALYLIAGCAASMAGIEWLATLCWVKAAIDTWCALREWRKHRQITETLEALR